MAAAVEPTFREESMRVSKAFRSVTAALAGVVVAMGVASAGPATYKIDPAHSEVGFDIRHIFTKVHGRFTRFTGTIVHDPQNLTASRVDVQIEAASISTDNDRRDQDLRSSNFFAVDSFPTLTFVSRSVSAGANGAIVVNGDLTMHGVTRPVTLNASFLGSGPAMGGVTRAGFEGSTRVNRKDWGIIWNRTLDSGNPMLADDVDIGIRIEAMLAAPAAGDGAQKK